MAKLIDIKLDAAGLEDVVRDLGRLDKTVLVGLTVRVVNHVATKVHKETVDKITGGLNLSTAYVEERLALKLADASQAKPVAKVISPMRNVTLGRFDAGQHSKPVTWSNDRIQAMGKKFSKWPGWTERKGDPSRGIAPDFKASGVDVTVKRGQPRDMNSAFLLPLANGGGRSGVFVHEGNKLKHLYGPAVYQIYRNHLEAKSDDIQKDLTNQFLVELDVELKALT